MSSGQLKATLLSLREDGGYGAIMEKLPAPLLHSISLDQLENAKELTWDVMERLSWTRPQAAFLVKKMLKKLQFGKLRSLIQGVTCPVVATATRQELRLLAEDFVENPQWVSRKLARCAARRYFQEEKVNFSSISVEELRDIPADFLIFLPSPHLRQLPASVCPAFLEKIEAANMNLLPLRGPSRPALLQRALECLGGNVSQLSVDDVTRLGTLVCDLEPTLQLPQMSLETLKYTLQVTAFCPEIRPRPPLKRLIREVFGNPRSWSEETLESWSSILYLDEEAVAALPNQPWVRDVLRYLRRRMPRSTEAIQRKWFDLATGASWSPKRKKRADDLDQRVPTVDLVQELDTANIYWSAQELGHMTAQTFSQTVEILGNIDGFIDEQLEKLCQKSVEVFGQPLQMNQSILLQLGCISRCFSSSDLAQMAFSLDVLDPLAHCGWTQAQMESVWAAVSGSDLGLTLQQMGAAELASLSQFICGLKGGEIEQLNLDVFRDSLSSLSQVWCSAEVGQQLKDLAIRAFGPPKSWTEPLVAELGNIMAWLEGEEMSSLDPQVFSFIHPTIIPRIPPESLAHLRVEQIQELGPDGAAAVTSTQRAAMSPRQVEALEGQEKGAGQSAESEKSGAGSLWADWTSVLRRALLCLLIGFLLL